MKYVSGGKRFSEAHPVMNRISDGQIYCLIFLSARITSALAANTLLGHFIPAV